MSPASTLTAPVGSGRANEVVLKRLGAITIGAARLERLAAEIAEAVKAPRTSGHAADALRAAAFTTPPWGSVPQKDVVAWATAACRLLDTRTAVFAASGGSRFTGTRGDTIAAEAVDGSVFPADEEFLTRLAQRFEKHLTAGAELRERLDYRDEQGRSWALVSIHRRAIQEPTPENQLRLPLEWTRWLTA